ncbi:MAG TPA: carboxyl transferase domain-containing protein [Jatrophihabitantaceae bacterium]
MEWQKELDELHLKRTLATRMGGEEGIARQRSQGRLTVRERIDLLTDKGTFEELSSTVGVAKYDDLGNLASFRPANTLAGFGQIDGRPICLRADDFTIRGGSTDTAAAGKRGIEQQAMEWRVPLVLLLDGAGGSVREVAGRDGAASANGSASPHAVANIPANPVVVRPAGTPGSRDVPPLPVAPQFPAVPRGDLATTLARGNPLAQIPVAAAVLGSAAGWIAIAAADSHFSVMTKTTSELFVAGPPLIKQALNLTISKQELGNYKIHAQQTGVINNVAEDEADALRQICTFLSYLPPNVWQLPPRSDPTDDPNRREDALASIIPRDRRKTYDVRRLIRHVVDKDSTFEISPLFGRAIVTMFARIDGFPVALIANDCRQDGGAQTAAACQKFERFVDVADTFHLPVVYLCDVPGFMIGPEAEKQGTIRWALRANIAVREATVPYISIITRRFYGVAVGGAKRGGGLTPRYAWPSAENGSLPAAGGVMAAFRRQIEAAPDPVAMRIDLEERLNTMASVTRRPQFVDEVIDPRDTRPLLVDFVRRAQELNAAQLGPKLRVGMRP